MTDETRSLPPEDTSRDQRLEGVLAEYLRRVDAGEAVDRQAIVVAHPDLAHELREFFANRAHVERIVGKPPEAGAMTADVPLQARFGDYELLDLIARGGMGVVYQARQVSLNRPVAVKMILAGQLASDADVKRFRAEAEAAANLRHPGVVSIYEVGIHDGQHFYSMEYVEGRTLSQVSRDGSLTAARAAEYVREMAEIVQYAHQQGVLHRDLKPSNVLIDRDDRVRITDFGLAKRVAGESDLTITGQVIGTPSYMPPEQAAAQHALVGAASDVYALGAILYELLTGRVPFRSDNVAETLRQVQQDDPVRPRLLSPRLSKDLETICLKCLEKEPRRRYATAQQLADELGRFLRGEPIQARPIRFWQRGLKWARRRPAVASLVVTLGLVVIVASVIVVQFWRNERVARKQAEANLAGQNVALARLHWSANRLDEARVLLASCPVEYRDSDWKQLWRVTHVQIASLHCRYGMGSVAFSHDGLMLAASTGDTGDTAGKLTPARVWDARTFAERDLRFEPGFAPALAFDKTGTLIVPRCTCPGKPHRLDDRSYIAGSPGSSASIRFIDFPSGRETVREFTASGRSLNALGELRAISPDGGSVAMTSLDGELTVVQVATGKESTIDLNGKSRATGVSTHVSLSQDGRRVATLMLGGPLIVWDVASGLVAGKFMHGNGISAASLSPDGHTAVLVVNIQNQVVTQILVLDVDSSTYQELSQESGGIVHQPAFRSDGAWIAVAARDNTITVWDLVTRQQVWTLRGHTGQIRGLAFSPDGTRLASASDDGTVRIWNIKLEP